MSPQILPNYYIVNLTSTPTGWLTDWLVICAAALVESPRCHEPWLLVKMNEAPTAPLSFWQKPINSINSRGVFLDFSV